MRNPDIYLRSNLVDNDPSTEISGKWISARPLPFYGLRLFHNIKLAWGVFTGKYDALKWDGGQ
jgi:hypothetical protein